MDDAHRLYAALFSHSSLSLSVFKLATPQQLSVIVDTLYPSFYPSFTILPPAEKSLQTSAQLQWNQLLADASPLRVAFVTHTLLSLLRLYVNKQANDDTIEKLRLILSVGRRFEELTPSWAARTSFAWRSM